MHFLKNIGVILNRYLLNVHNVALEEEKKKKDYTNERKQVAELIMDVLVNKLCVREALLKFQKNCDDVCCAVAWHALMHFEADEDISAKDTVFRDVQVDFLEGLYNILVEGKDLPDSLIQGYNKYHKGVDTCRCSGKEYFWHEMKKNINMEP